MNHRTGKTTHIKELLKEIGINPSMEFAIQCGKALYHLHFWQAQDPSRRFNLSREMGVWCVELWTDRVKKIRPLMEKSENLETAVNEALRRFAGG